MQRSYFAEDVFCFQYFIITADSPFKSFHTWSQHKDSSESGVFVLKGYLKVELHVAAYSVV